MRIQDFDTWFDRNDGDLYDKYQDYLDECYEDDITPESWDEFVSNEYESYTSELEDYEYDMEMDRRMMDE